MLTNGIWLPQITETVIGLLETLFGLAHGIELNITTHTREVLVMGAMVRVGSVPTKCPFTIHWYVGAEPPFIGTAVNLTGDPAQTVVAELTMETLGIIAGVFTITMLLVDNCGVAQLNELCTTTFI